MKTTVYYILLLVLVAAIAGYLIPNRTVDLGIQQKLLVSALLIAYVAGFVMAGKDKRGVPDGSERKHLSDEAALLAAQVMLVVGIIFQIFTRSLGFWLLAVLLIVNLVKILVLVYVDSIAGQIKNPPPREEG